MMRSTDLLRPLCLALLLISAAAAPLARVPFAAARQDTLPGNGLIAFSADRDGDFDIFVVDPRGGTPQPLTNNALDDLYPRWSPDGTRVVYYQQHPETGAGDIMVMDADGSNQIALTQGGAAGISSVLPSWSPDGARIVFTRRESDQRQQIYIMRPDGSGLLQVSALGLDAFGPQWSLDGDWIVFTGQWATNAGFLTDVFALSLVDGSVQRLTEDGQSKAAYDWSPDGGQVLLRIRPDEDGGDDDIYTLDVSRGTLTALTDDPANDWMPAWAPDGSAVVFVSDRGGTDALYLMDPDGGNVRPLLDLGEGVALRLPHWQPLPAE